MSLIWDKPVVKDVLNIFGGKIRNIVSIRSDNNGYRTNQHAESNKQPKSDS